MKQFDAVVIGGGILGCFAARNLRRWNISTALVEAETDICTGITRANSAVVYAGYDNKPGSLKAQMTVRGNAGFDALCRELAVSFSRCGSLLVSCSQETDAILRKKLRQGLLNSVPGLQLISGEEARAMEPMLTAEVRSALYAPTTGTVNPWQLAIAAYENALQNGCVPMLGTRVMGIERRDDLYILQTTGGKIACRAVINCAGLCSDRVQEMLFPPSVRLQLDGADYLVLDELTPKPGRIIFHQDDTCGKGITAIPCVEGNLLLSGTRRPLDRPFSTTPEGLRGLHAAAQRLLPHIDLTKVIRSFGAVRPNPHRVVEREGNFVPDGSGIGSFCIEHPAPGFYSLIGIKTPGLTCAQELGLHVAARCAAELGSTVNPTFDPRRPVTSHEEQDGHIVCQCGQVTKGEILDAIARGARTVDGVKRRVGSGMGRCQGSRCTHEIEKLLEAYAHGEV